MNKHSLPLLFLIALLVATPADAQKRKHKVQPKAKVTATKNAATDTGTHPAASPAQQAIEAYDFEAAVQLLEKEIATLKRKRQSTASAEALLHTAQEGLTKLHATERIIIIDGVVCPRQQVLKAIRISQESGRIDTYASTYHTTDDSGATLYENDLGNKRFLALPHQLRLAVSDKIGNQWSEPTPLTGLSDEDTSQNFPFLLADGITLYYAAKGPESMGGYDIFVTRADGADGSFFTPENIGFPFNSTANDYLMAIDEMNQLGWFVSDRRQPEGKVCIYTFIPNGTRQLYGDETSDEQLRSLARITSIRSTWPSAKDNDVQAALTRLAELRAGKYDKKKDEREFTFIIDDKRTYTRLADFRSPQAREKMQQYMTLDKAVQTDGTMIQRLRDNYAKAQAPEKQQIAQSILRLEATHYTQLSQLKQLAKEIRNAEITHQ